MAFSSPSLRSAGCGLLLFLVVGAQSWAQSVPQQGQKAPDPWGVLSGFAGESWFDEKFDTTITYRWKVPNEILTATAERPDGVFENTFELDAEGAAINLRPDPKLNSTNVFRLVSPRAGMSVETAVGSPDARFVLRRVGDQLFITDERLKNGVWVPEASRTRRKVSEVERLQIAAGRAERAAAAQAKREEERAAQMAAQTAAQAAERAKQAAESAELERRWGVLAKIAGAGWMGEHYVRVWWIERDVKLAVNWYNTDTLELEAWQRYVRDERSGEIFDEGIEWRRFRVLPDGTLFTSDGLNHAYVLHEDGRWAIAKGRVTKGEFVYLGDRSERFSRLQAARTNELDARAKKVREDGERAKAAAAANKGSGGGLGSILGATAGAALVGAAGGNTDQIIGGALKGAAIVNPDSAASAALDSAGSQFLGGAGSVGTMGLGGSAVGASSAGVRPNFPTKPNLATSACAGFTESNYRQKAFEGGPDTQLLTMCGQAFEYYTMYKRAIAQGYSEEDCNRTYAAHEQSARVAINFLAGR